MPDELTTGPSSQPPSGGSSAPVTNEPGQTGQGGNEGTPPASPASASSSTNPSQGSPTPPAGQPAPGQQPPAWTSIREAAYQNYGIDLRNLPDDQAALRHLVGQASQAQQSQAYAQRYLQHAGQFEQWLQGQQQQQQQKPAGWWNPPEYNPAWRNLVTRDEHGQYQLAPGAPPDVLPKLLAYEQYRRDFADKLTSDPVATLKPFVSDVAREIAQGMVQEHLQSYQDKVAADQIINNNSSWLHQRDQQGNVVADPFTRQPMLSPLGQRFKGYVERLHQAGVTNIHIQEQQARALVERDLAMAQLAQIQQGQDNGQIKNQFLQNNNIRQPNQSGVLAPVAGQPSAPAQSGLSLAQRLAQRFRENGVTDADFTVSATTAAR